MTKGKLTEVGFPFFFCFFEKRLDIHKNRLYIISVMKNKITYNFNGGWTSGEAHRHVGIRKTEKVHTSKKAYNRKDKHRKRYV